MREDCGVAANNRLVLLGREINPLRKLRMELKQEQILATLSAGGLDTQQEDGLARQRALLHCLDNSQKKIESTIRDNIQWEIAEVQKKEEEEQSKMTALQQALAKAKARPMGQRAVKSQQSVTAKKSTNRRRSR